MVTAMDDYELSLLVLMGNVERLAALRGVDRAYQPLLLQRMEGYLARIEQELGHLRRLRLGCLGELQYAADRRLSGQVAPVRAAQARLRFAERMLVRLARYRRELEERRAELRVKRQYPR